MITVACVYRRGKDFKPEHVHALQCMVAKHFKAPHRFVCLTDVPLQGLEIIRLQHQWPSWWSKLELFRPGLFSGRVVYLDLDTVLPGDVTDMFSGPHEFTALQTDKRDPSGPILGSGLMAWRPGNDLSKIYESFDISKATRYVSDWRRFGDQGWIMDHLQRPWQTWEELFPGKVLSFKKDVRGPTKNHHARAPRDASIVCFSGNPRPWNLPKDSPLYRQWSGE